MREKINLVLNNLTKNNFEPYFLETKDEVLPLISKLISPDSLVGVGGSMTLFECGIIDFLRSNNYKFLDRYKENLTAEEITDIYRKSFYADTYISSSNAITECGELFNTDGNSNRVAAICYGPSQVIIIVGINKIVKNIDEAIMRLKNVAAPNNTKRLNCNTPCLHTGKCVHYETTDFSGCSSQDRICCN